MSDDFERDLKLWCEQAKPLVGLPPSSSSGKDVRQKWIAFQKLIEENKKAAGIPEKRWDEIKLQVEGAIKARELLPEDLSDVKDPMETLTKLSERILKGRELTLRAKNVGVKAAGMKLLGNSPDRENQLAILESAVKHWGTLDTEVGKYVENYMILSGEPDLWKKAQETRPGRGELDDQVAAADAVGVQGTLASYSEWWTGTRALLEKVRKLKREYGEGANKVEAWQWDDLATVASQLDGLEEDLRKAVADARENLKEKNRDIEGKKTFESMIDQVEREYLSSLKVWNTTVNVLDKAYVGQQAAEVIVTLVERAQDLAVSEEFVIEDVEKIEDPNWTKLETDLKNKYNAFAQAGSPAARLQARGPSAPRELRAYLTENFKIDQGVTVGGRRYTVANSDTAGVAFHTPIPNKLLIPNRPNVRSFIYHFR